MTLPGDWRHLLAGCDPAQEEAITTTASPLLVVAGAGSGKTRVLTRRIAWQVVHERVAPSHVLALTFTRKAAGELRVRLAGLGLPAPVTAGTFHAVALAQLRRRAIDTGRPPPVLLTAKARLLAPILAELSPPRPSRRSRTVTVAGAEREQVATAAAEIEWAKSRLVTPEDYPAAARAAGRAAPLEPSALAHCYRVYEQERQRRGLLDFDDLLIGLLRALEEDRAFAAAQRWQFAHLFVDELQDATTLQLRLVDAWLGGREELFAVGDPRQSVYAWNGADPEAIAGFPGRHPGATVLELGTNYRSSPQIVAVAAAALGGARLGGGGHRMPPGSGGAMERTVGVLGQPRSARPDGPVPSLRVYPDEQAEAAAAVATLRKAHRPGRPWSACAVLARTNAQLEVVAAACETAGIPTSAQSLGATLNEPVVREALGDLPATTDAGLLRSWLHELAEQAPAEGERAALTTLSQLAEDYLALDRLPSREGFLAFLRTAAREGSALPRSEGVELATFHRAKGLEWEVVLVVGLEDGLVPIAHAEGPAALEEEQRLLYVALTRATEELHCSWAAARRFGERRSAREPSPYLPALESACRRLERLASPSREAVADALAVSRAALAAGRQALGAAERPATTPTREQAGSEGETPRG